jgi:DNA-binding LytR/AlgR family response regulator
VRRITTAAWTWGFGLYAYLATTLCAAWYARRASGGALEVGRSLAWQGASYAAWVPVAALVWLILRRYDARGRGMIALALSAVVVAPLESLAAAWIDMAFVGGEGWSEASGRALGRLPVSILLYTAIAAVGVAAAHHRRIGLERARSDRLEAALMAARARLESPKPERLMVAAGSRRVPVLLSQVEWFAAAGNYVVVHWDQREGLVRETLQNLEARLDPAVFARSHRSTVVNLARVRETQSLSDGSWRLVLQSGAELVASRTYRDALLARLGR